MRATYSKVLVNVYKSFKERSQNTPSDILTHYGDIHGPAAEVLRIPYFSDGTTVFNNIHMEECSLVHDMKCEEYKYFC